ncbi:5-oxopent-3-ene-1,2,5-tricarboxylate decarboxylase/2-hydroxyhepta-2,4-diene-1,7-dioate isomerase [Novosphingobium chloroacetimidivorans]|uniref:5-oxopent-3-ene-1,2,5-tricarboxylate decarboxylase/2-hydroxyhepta-2,4-diene-1,7-dioate isomerase n=1 Tax=Novosphingobium chloroacetimidivorans TaxID=1428314 RepID=A0A7W7K9C9_9SPHN|nr:fumarylacetoacetate hydrolase family protein [Novosphingobium chloroacetimidivorans]MBB4858642.1 5-oxopent-3-ene-1,2,5-tricarboxylate decarboxylase/2-hydroxyhepta-2,4-diene-1,7-dioate isomerase [Novosphingobium chloroacetimidivorans]
MIVSGTIYGVVLNDADERAALADAFNADPYKAPPQAPVVYIKPRLCATVGGAPVPLPAGESEVTVAATVALLFGRDATAGSEDAALSHVEAACLALDVSLPSASYYRPAIAERCRDGFLPLGHAGDVCLPDEIVTFVDGVEAHRWPLSRLVRSAEKLIAELSSFMTLQAGDLLLIGLPGEAPRARAGQSVRVEAEGFAPIAVSITTEAALAEVA